MKIVVLDGYTENPGDLSWDGLKQFGEVEVYDRTSYVEPPHRRAHRRRRDRGHEQDPHLQRDH